MTEIEKLNIKKEPKRISSKMFFSIIITLCVLVGGFVVYFEKYLIDDFSDYKMNANPSGLQK